jgi:uncharacterized damage-inducible protein DinB
VVGTRRECPERYLTYSLCKQIEIITNLAGEVVLTMNSAEITELYSYNNWANDKLLQFIGTLNSVDFTRDMSNSFGSIRDTVVHILSAEELWLSRWIGEESRMLLDPSTFTDFGSINNRWGVHQSNINHFSSSLTDDDLTQLISYKNVKGIPYSLELWKQMLHMVNHSSFHRGQVITMGRQLKLQPPSLDLIYYYLAHR